MSRYLLFAGMDYYPAGGMADLRGAGDSVDELKDLLSSGSLTFSAYPTHQAPDWWHIFDLEEKKLVASDGKDRGGCSETSYMHRWVK